MDKTVAAQRKFFQSGATLPYAFRVKQLKTLYGAIKQNEARIIAALQYDLGKCPFESYATELSMVYMEIKHTLKHLKDWMKDQRVPTPVTSFGGQSYIHRQPLGVVLIMAPWNYPFQLSIAPLVAAMAAGNCVVLKPSRYARQTSALLARLIAAHFPPEYIALFEGGKEVNTALLENRFDHIFFTGSVRVGKIVLAAAAKHLTPVTLELGGKSPCLVDQTVGSTADLEKTAQRIIWGKALNAGQTCVAPDYVLVHRAVRQDLIGAMQEAIRKFFGKSPLLSPDFGKIIHAEAFDRLQGMITAEKDRIITGGTSDRTQLKIELTLVDQPALDSPLMTEEIFGPILPIIPYERLTEAVEIIRSREKPLALYIFTKDKNLEAWVVNNLLYGGGCINDTIMHVANHHLPFGGVGASGLGSYHGEKGIATFSHAKSILKQTYAFEVPLRYPPYKERLNLLKKIIR
ncbi:MAG: aldehyde dehydrogenase [Firmicutes bacterium]|nr:aldehyde dehydrogenase [Bacillota bacterium]